MSEPIRAKKYNRSYPKVEQSHDLEDEDIDDEVDVPSSAAGLKNLLISKNSNQLFKGIQ